MMLPTMLDLISGYVTTQEAVIETVDGSFTPVDQLRWFDRIGNRVTQFYERGDPEHAGLFALTPTMQNIPYSAVVDSSTGGWKKPPIVCVPGPIYQWGVFPWLDRCDDFVDYDMDMGNVWPLRRPKEAYFFMAKRQAPRSVSQYP
jgi:hypothetical protein